MPLTSFRDLRAWQRAMELLVESHRLADRLPYVQRFALADQIRRAAVSVPANIAEGYGRVHRGDYIRHLLIARGSARELESHLEGCARLDYLRAEELRTAFILVDQVSRLRLNLTRSLGGR